MIDNRTVQSIVYERILKGEPYIDLLESVQVKTRQREILEKIERYRKVESLDMNAMMRAQLTGLTKSTCRDMNKVYERCALKGIVA